MSKLVIYTPDGRPIGPEVIDQADLFRFVCSMASPGLVYDWWEQYPIESLPNAGRQPENVEEAEKFIRHTRALAIEMGLWSAL